MKRTFFFFSSRRRHTRSKRDWSSDVCSSDLPVLAEGADDAAVAVAGAGGVVPALPGADRGEVRRLRRRRAPLVARVVRNAVHADLAAAPLLRRRPLDAVLKVARLARIVVAQVAGRAPGAARIDAH